MPLEERAPPVAQLFKLATAPHLVPRVGVAVSVFARRAQLVSLRRVVLIRRAAPPALNLLSLPGGRLELGERIAACAAREAREETGLLVDVDGELGFCASDASSPATSNGGGSGGGGGGGGYAGAARAGAGPATPTSIAASMCTTA